MKVVDKIAVGLGILDIAYVVWISLRIALGGGNFGLPFTHFEIVVNVVVYLTIAACGAALVLRYSPLVWLNYCLLPIRIVLVIPTLYPVFGLLAVLGFAISPSVELKILVLSELARCLFILWWRRNRRKQPDIDTGAHGV